MRNCSVILFILFCYVFSFGQKKEIYGNESFEIISEIKFYQIHNHSSNFIVRYGLDSCFLNVTVPRIKKGKIALSQLDSIKKFFIKNKNYQNHHDINVILINYYPGNDQCSTNGYKQNFSKMYYKFRRVITRIENSEQLFIYKSKDALEKFGRKIPWQPDINKLIETTFFPIHSPCGGFVIIDHKGNYHVERGEYCYSKLLIKEIKNFAKLGANPRNYS